MKKLIIFFFFLFLFFPYSGNCTVLKISLNAPIHPITSEYIIKSIEEAEKAQADLLIISINTPGGLDTSMREIIERILSSSVPIAVYVSPSGSRAASAGFFIGIASDLFLMAPGTNTGAAHPVGVSLTGKQMDDTMSKKITNDASSYIKSLAEKRKRNAQMAVDAVRKSLSYTEKEAFEGGLIDAIIKSDQELLEYFDKKTINRFNGKEFTFDLKDKKIIKVEMSARQKFLLTISNPNLAYLLLMIGLLGLYFEFSNPGAILPGVLGGISLLIAIFSFQILPINYVGLIFILLSIGLFILEIKIQSYGILSAGGLIAMFIGSIMLIDSPIPELRPSLKFIIPVVLGLCLIFIFLIALTIKVHARRAVTGREGLIGEVGTASTSLSPEGKVFVHGEIWNACSDEKIKKGSRVEIVEVQNNLRIKVKKA